MRPVQLAGPRLAIREFHHTPEEVDALHAIFGDPETSRHLPSWPPDWEACADQLALYVETALEEPRKEYRLAVTLRADGADAAPLGHAVLTLGGYRAGTVGYALRRDTWGQGYASEILRLLCEFGFRTLGLHRLDARVDPTNAASARVLTKAGFQLDGRIRHDNFRAGSWHDLELYSLLEDEWVEPAAA